MNVTFVFFLVICILIIAFSVFTTLIPVDQEGYVGIDVNQWDVDGMRTVINDLNNQGIQYQVNDYSSHINMLVNRFGVKYTQVTLNVSNADFPIFDDGKCYRDDPGRKLPYGYGMPAKWVGWERRGWWWHPKYRYVLMNNYNNCKNIANRNKHNTFGLQWGQECWTGNTNDVMVNDKNQQLIRISDSACNKGGINDDETGGGWSNMVYKKITTKTVNRITNYENIIRQFVSSNLHNDADVSSAQNFNISGFTTMEGFTPRIVNGIPITGRDIDAQDKIKITGQNSQNVNIVTNNIIDTIVNNGYKVQTTDFTEFTNKFKKPGKNMTDLTKYIQTMKSIGINSETIANKMVERLKPYCSNGDAPFHDIIKLITVNFKKYKITNVSAIFNKFSPKEEDGWFIQAVKSHQLHTLSSPLLPSTVGNASSDSVMEKMYAVNNSIKTIGMNFMPKFFSDFNAYGINGASFFNNIYPIYSDPNLEIYNYQPVGSVNDRLSDALYKINGLSNSGLISAFQTLKSLLGQLNLNFNNYVQFTIQLKSRVLYTDIITVWNDFKTYYKTIAYPSPASPPDANVTTVTLISWIDEMNRSSKSSTYFSNNEGNFDTFLKILINTKYTTSRLKSDIGIGQTYDEFMNMHSNEDVPPKPTSQPQLQGFSNMAYNENDMDVFQIISRWARSLLGMNQYVETLESTEASESDKTILNKFGITDFNQQLLSVENKLRQYGVKDMDSTKTEWVNIVNVIDKLTLASITINQLDDFVTLMINFNAKTITEWYDVLDKLTQIKIQSYDTIKTFLTEITDFGVKYKHNFDLFIQYLNVFESNFSDGNLTPIITFMKDMKKTQNTYHLTEGTNVVNEIIKYFTNYKFPLMVYYSNSPFNACEKTLPKNFPSLLVNSLYDYGNTGSYGNKLYDIQANKNPQILFKLCDVVNAMQEAYMITNLRNEYNGRIALIVPNVAIISSFFYQEEMNKIVKIKDHYSSNSKRVSMINDIADGMIRYSAIFKADRKTEFDLYNNIAKFLKIFPVLSFQYLSNEFMEKCSDNKECWYNLYVDPGYSECKASTSNRTLNYRPKPPVL